MSWEAAEQERRTSNFLRIGRISQIDAAAAVVKVIVGGLESDWVPFMTSRAGPDRVWHPPEIGEQVVIASPYGDLAQAIVLGSLYQDAYPAPAASADTHKTLYSDGAFVQYDRQNHQYTVSIPASGSLLFKVGAVTLTVTNQGVSWASPHMTTTGDFTATGDVKGSSVSLHDHIHRGVISGGSNSGPPVTS